MQQNEQERTEEEVRAREVAYRQGYLRAVEEIGQLILQLVELGYKIREIKQLIAVYDDHFLAPWRQKEDVSRREAPPPFDINQCKAILEATTGYDWII